FDQLPYVHDSYREITQSIAASVIRHSAVVVLKSRALESHVAKTVSSGLCLQKRCRAVHSGVEISVALVKRAFDPITYVREVLPLFFNKAFLPSFTLISIMIYGPDLNYSKRKQYKRPKPLLAPSLSGLSAMRPAATAINVT